MKSLDQLSLLAMAYGAGLLAAGLQDEAWRKHLFLIGMILVVLRLPVSIILALQSRKKVQG